MSKFLASLDMRLLVDAAGKPLSNRDGRQLYQLLSDLVYQSDVAGLTITARAGYVTDLASVPRYPIVYDAFGDTAQEEGTIHDYLYSTGLLPREVADAVLLEAMAVNGVPAWRRYPMYWAVRMFGGSHFSRTCSESPAQ